LDKKGFYLLVGLISLVVVLIVLLVFTLYVWRPFVVDSVGDWTCLMSVMIKTYTRQPPLLQYIPIVGDTTFGINSPFDLNCKMHDKKLKKKDDAKKVISKEMANCWGRLGEGKFDFYTNVDYTGWFRDNNLCYVCARVTSDEDVKVISQDMIQYLRDKKPKPLLDTRTYEQYITGSGFKEGEFLNSVGDFEIKNDDPLFVLFMVNKQETFLNRLQRGVITAAEFSIMDLIFRGKNSVIASGFSGGKEGIRTSGDRVTKTIGRDGKSYYHYIGKGSDGKSTARFANQQEIKLFDGGGGKRATGKLSGAIKGASKGVARRLTFWIGAGAGAANSLFVSKGFNANVVATNSEGVRELCGGYAK